MLRKCQYFLQAYGPYDWESKNSTVCQRVNVVNIGVTFVPVILYDCNFLFATKFSPCMPVSQASTKYHMVPL